MKSIQLTLKYFFIFIISVLSFVIYKHLTMEEINDITSEETKLVVRVGTGWIIMSIISLFIIVYCPSYYIVIARMFLAFVVVGNAEMNASLPAYAVHEYWLPWLSFLIYYGYNCTKLLEKQWDCFLHFHSYIT